VSRKRLRPPRAKPYFFGVIEDIPAIAAIAHAKGALLIVSIGKRFSLGVVRPPSSGYRQPGGQSFGSPQLRRSVLRRPRGQGAVRPPDAGAPRRRPSMAPVTADLSLRSPRASNTFAAKKATSNICTNQALVALMATIFLSVYGKEGIRE